MTVASGEIDHKKAADSISPTNQSEAGRSILPRSYDKDFGSFLVDGEGEVRICCEFVVQPYCDFCINSLISQVDGTGSCRTAIATAVNTHEITVICCLSISAAERKHGRRPLLTLVPYGFGRCHRC